MHDGLGFIFFRDKFLRQPLIQPLNLGFLNQQQHGLLQVFVIPRFFDAPFQPSMIHRVHDIIKSGVAGKDDRHDIRIFFMHDFQKMRALHSRHDLVRDDDIHLFALLFEFIQHSQGFFRAFGHLDFAGIADGMLQLG